MERTFPSYRVSLRAHQIQNAICSYCPEGNSICKARREKGSHQTKPWTTLDKRQLAVLLSVQS